MRRVRKGMTREEVSSLVCTALDASGIPVVLSGGGAVAIYAENEYESYDLDFIATGLARKVDSVMKELGFRKEGRHWLHPKSPFWVEFPPGPVAVGNEILTKFAERRTDFGTLRLLAPTDCVMDRLAAYYHWSDTQSLEQAVAVARRHSIDLGRIEAWSHREGEGALTLFHEFSRRLHRKRDSLTR